MPIHTARIPILGRNRDMSKISSILSHKAFRLHASNHATNRVAKELTIQAEIKSSVVLVTSRNGFMTTERTWTHKLTNKVFLAQRVFQIREKVPFLILVTNFSTRPVTLPNNMLTAVRI